MKTITTRLGFLGKKTGMRKIELKQETLKLNKRKKKCKYIQNMETICKKIRKNIKKITTNINIILILDFLRKQMFPSRKR